MYVCSFPSWAQYWIVCKWVNACNLSDSSNYILNVWHCGAVIFCMIVIFLLVTIRLVCCILLPFIWFLVSIYFFSGADTPISTPKSIPRRFWILLHSFYGRPFFWYDYKMIVMILFSFNILFFALNKTPKSQLKFFDQDLLLMRRFGHYGTIKKTFCKKNSLVSSFKRIIIYVS